MGRLRDRWEQGLRILSLLERWLERNTGAGPDPRAFERTHAFRWDARHGPGRIVPVEIPARFELADLIGVERSLERLIRNTEQFLAGLPAHHVLLHGERGTGKSSAVRGLMTRFGAKGLRVVEVHRDDLIDLPDILTALRGLPYRFFLFTDDLSFSEGEPQYRELKAALDGSLAGPPENVRIVATSNRRHLIPERRSENQAVRLDEDGEIRMGEALEEKLALADRFGLVLPFYSFDQETYLRIVRHYAAKAGLELAPETLREEALRFTLERSSRSGRTARQFVDEQAGRQGLEGVDAAEAGK